MSRYAYSPAYRTGIDNSGNENQINPMEYCVVNKSDNQFFNGSQAKNLGEDSKQCQAYLGDYCSKRWDIFCEAASKNTKLAVTQNTGNNVAELSGGELLIRNAAFNRYLVKMVNAHKQYEPFDHTVAFSPMISFWVPDNLNKQMVPVHEITPENIISLDSDPVMNRLLANPEIGLDILENIRNTMKKKNTLSQLHGTRLGYFYSTNPYFHSLGGLR